MPYKLFSYYPKYLTITTKIFCLLAITLSIGCASTVNPGINDFSQKPVKISTIGQKLQTMKHDELKTYFKTLDAPSFDEMDGPYRGNLLAAAGIFSAVSNAISANNPISGKWEGLYIIQHPNKPQTGYVYNMFGKKHRVLKMGCNTRVQASKLDDKQSFYIDCFPYHHMFGYIKGWDELRKIDDENYLMLSYTDRLFFYPPMIHHLQRIK